MSQRLLRLTVQVMAIIGPRGVGKSTIIERGLKRPTSTIIASDNQQNQSACRSARRLSLTPAVTSYRAVLISGGRERSIEVLEVDSALMQYDDGGIRWPKYLPQIDGALICYDATVEGGLQSLTRVLGTRLEAKLRLTSQPASGPAARRSASPLSATKSARTIATTASTRAWRPIRRRSTTPASSSSTAPRTTRRSSSRSSSGSSSRSTGSAVRNYRRMQL